MSHLGEPVQLPADAREMSSLAERMSARATLDPPSPRVDDGILRFRGRLVALSPIEERLARTLVDDAGSVVSQSRLLSGAWKDKAVGSTALRTNMTRLRHRLAPLGLRVRSVRGLGYLIETPGRL